MAPINSAPTRFSGGSPDPNIRKWTLQCSCVPKGVGAAFCSKTAPFLSYAPNKPSGGLVCPRRSRPRSAAKQGRSFRVAPINSAPTRFSGGSPDPNIRKWTLECSCVPKGVGAAFCSKTAPFLSYAPNKPSGGLVCPRRSRPRSAAKQGRSFRVAPINSAPTRFSGGSPDPNIRKWTLECSCVPKGVGAAFCSKTAPFLLYAPNKPSGGLCARDGRGHVLQQNRAVLFVRLQYTLPRLDLVAATSWERVPPEIGHRPRVKRTFYEKNLTSQTPALNSKSRNGGWAGGS